MLSVDGDVRPGPEDTAMVQVVGGEVVGQDLAVEAVERVNVATMRLRGWSARLRQHAMIVNQDRPIALPEPQRCLVNGLEPKRPGLSACAGPARPTMPRVIAPTRVAGNRLILLWDFASNRMGLLHWPSGTLDREPGNACLIDLDAQSRAVRHGQFPLGNNQRVLQDRAVKELRAVKSSGILQVIGSVKHQGGGKRKIGIGQTAAQKHEAFVTARSRSAASLPSGRRTAGFMATPSSKPSLMNSISSTDETIPSSMMIGSTSAGGGGDIP